MTSGAGGAGAFMGVRFVISFFDSARLARVAGGCRSGKRVVDGHTGGKPYQENVMAFAILAVTGHVGYIE